MAIFYQPAPKQKAERAFEGMCSGLDIHGRGVVRTADVIYFVPGLMPGETARLLQQGVKDRAGMAKLLKILKPSEYRRAADCPLSERCGGCPLAHLPSEMALEAKARGIRRLFTRALKSDIGEPAFKAASSATAYRRVCRLSARSDHGRVVLGFRAASSQEVVPVKECLVLEASLNALLEPVSRLVNSLSCRKKVGHVELVKSDGAVGMLLRLTCELDSADEDKLKTFCEKYGTVLYAQEPFIHHITHEEQLKERLIGGDPSKLFLRLKGQQVTFTPSAFVQINSALNAVMQDKVLEALPQGENLKILDLFCGLGNFSFPCAAQGHQVTGVDIVKSMVEAANHNAESLGLADKAKFWIADLEAQFEQQRWANAGYDAVILDPGRSGAKRACEFLIKAKEKRLIMISCNPLAAARDVKMLTEAGYRVLSWGVFDMFARTSHIEMLIVLEYQGQGSKKEP